MKNYIYNADIGTFNIRQTGHLRYELWIKEELLGEYESAELARARSYPPAGSGLEQGRTNALCSSRNPGPVPAAGRCN